MEVQVDPSAGSHTTIEDCTVCCHPMELHVEVGRDGTLMVEARRDDE